MLLISTALMLMHIFATVCVLLVIMSVVYWYMHIYGTVQLLINDIRIAPGIPPQTESQMLIKYDDVNTGDRPTKHWVGQDIDIYTKSLGTIKAKVLSVKGKNQLIASFVDYETAEYNYMPGDYARVRVKNK